MDWYFSLKGVWSSSLVLRHDKVSAVCSFIPVLLKTLSSIFDHLKRYGASLVVASAVVSSQRLMNSPDLEASSFQVRAKTVKGHKSSSYSLNFCPASVIFSYVSKSGIHQDVYFYCILLVEIRIQFASLMRSFAVCSVLPLR